MINRKRELFNLSINKNFFIFILISLFILNFIIFSVLAQNDAVNRVINEAVPGAGIIDKINPEELPDKISELKENIDSYRKGEQNKSFLMKEWTKILANKPVAGPFMFYTDKFFSVFNPVWQYSFGMGFSWSFAFFAHIFLWSIIVFFVYIPFRDVLKNRLFGFLSGAIVASITGTLGVIGNFVKILSAFLGNIVYLILAIIFVILVCKLYEEIWKNIKKEGEKADERKNEKNIETLGKVAGEALENLAGKNENEKWLKENNFWWWLMGLFALIIIIVLVFKLVM